MPGFNSPLLRPAIMLFLCAVLVGCGADSKTDTGAADADPDSLRIALTGSEGKTPLELLAARHDVVYRSTAMGAFVTRVDEAVSGADYAWVYSVNDSLPNAACDKYLTTATDRVVWHFRRMQR